MNHQKERLAFCAGGYVGSAAGAILAGGAYAVAYGTNFAIVLSILFAFFASLPLILLWSTVYRQGSPRQDLMDLSNEYVDDQYKSDFAASALRCADCGQNYIYIDGAWVHSCPPTAQPAWRVVNESKKW